MTRGNYLHAAMLGTYGVPFIRRDDDSYIRNLPRQIVSKTYGRQLAFCQQDWQWPSITGTVGRMVLLVGVEPTTCDLRDRCSTN